MTIFIDHNQIYHQGSLRFDCQSCLYSFKFSHEDVYLNRQGDLCFTPEPFCPRCGSTTAIIFTDSAQHKIERLLTRRAIRME